MENWMIFSEILEEKTAFCEKVIASYLPVAAGEAALVAEAMNYSVEAGGKRLRPIFIMETCRMYNGRQELAEPFMAAIEMIHTYSLVHDDLPAMDNDRYRRGKLTTHAAYGEGMAVLAGDGLLNYAFETVLKAFDHASAEETACIVRAVKILAENAGINGMIGGQCADLDAEEHPEKVNGTLIRYIHRNKTAKMIESGFQIGAVLAGAPEEDIRTLGRIAENIGIAFQIRDDILDVIGDSGELGKEAGSDEKEGKKTYVGIYGLEKSREDVRRMTEEAVAMYDGLSARNDFLRELLLQLTDRNK